MIHLPDDPPPSTLRYWERLAGPGRIATVLATAQWAALCIEHSHTAEDIDAARAIHLAALEAAAELFRARNDAETGIAAARAALRNRPVPALPAQENRPYRNVEIAGGVL